MINSKVIHVDDNSPKFLLELNRRIEFAKNPKNRTPFSQAEKVIIEKYNELVVARV